MLNHVCCLPGGGKVRGGSGAFFLLLLVGLRPPSLDTAAGVGTYLYTHTPSLTYLFL